MNKEEKIDELEQQLHYTKQEKKSLKESLVMSIIITIALAIALLLAVHGIESSGLTHEQVCVINGWEGTMELDGKEVCFLNDYNGHLEFAEIVPVWDREQRNYNVTYPYPYDNSKRLIIRT